MTADKKKMKRNEVTDSGESKTSNPTTAKVLTLLASYALGGVTVVLTPAREWVIDKVWGSRVEISIHRETNDKIVVGDVVRLRIALRSASTAAIPDGTFSIEDKNGVLKPEPNVKIESEYKNLGSATLVPASAKPPLAFRAIRPGHGNLVVTLTTHYSLQKSESQVLEVEPSDPTGPPRLANLSGHWKASLGPHLGDMRLQQDGNVVSGSVEFDESGPSGAISGTNDSYRVLRLTSTKTPSMWVASNCKLGTDKGNIGFEGAAIEYVSAEGIWKPSGRVEQLKAWADLR